ncbi:DUF177 domain-containing protein [Lentisphaera profundi]|uniref:DUF177 domain-containing protein n=1 Tax=Lentisphaera profundi TaxID=1658616 RepID=A0ABY7VPJ4_9BACT|nr:DUF177 domain-containing protein [Lentisphaera profundi]WDE96078.1 DUF177 domain-containing protein [Lentisphaera profundi]
MPLHALQINKFHIPELGVKIQGDLDSSLLKLPISYREKSYGPLKAQLDVTMIDHMDALLIRGFASVAMQCNCDRCDSNFTHLLESEEICHHIENCPDIIDLTEYIREDILLTFPQHYLCRDDCKGLCSGCAANLNKESCQCSKPDNGGSFDNTLDNINFD